MKDAGVLARACSLGSGMGGPGPGSLKALPAKDATAW